MKIRRVLLRSLALAGVLLACFAHLVWNGRNATRVVAENLPHPLLSSGTRDIDLWHSTESFGHVYDLTFDWPEEKPWRFPDGARLQVQLVSNGRARPLVVRRGHPNDTVSWWDVLRGRQRVHIVSDREWVDLGTLPESGTRMDVQVLGLLPGPFGFAEPHVPLTEHFSGFRLRRPDSPRARPARSILRYRFVIDAPVTAGETLARFFFFISCSRVLQVAGLVAIGLLFAGWWWLWEGRLTRAVAALVPAVTLLHACGLAPFQGADEATHAGTVEAVVWNPGLFATPMSYPKSLARLYEAIGYDRWVRYPEVPVSIDSPERRARVRSVSELVLATEAAQGGPMLPDAFLNDPRTRASLYYNAFRIPGPLLRRMSVLDRLEAYVVLSAAGSLLLFGAGLLLLARSGAAAPIPLAYAASALLPYSVGVVASCSNYALAIGIGQFLSACLVVGVLAESPRTRLTMTGLFTLVSVVGIGVWDDFVFLAAPSTVVLAFSFAHAAARLPAGPRRRFATGVAVVVGIVLTGAFAFALATGRVRHAVSSFGARLPKSLGGAEDPSFWLLLAVAAAPFVTSLGLALAIVRSPGISREDRRRAALVRAGVLAALFVALFLVTPWSAVPFENVRFDYPDEVAAHWSAFWSNNFAFDQDVLSWKMYWGIFGYADVLYPDVVYALARWGCVALFLALPVLSWRFTHGSPGRSAFLLLVSGYALSACIVTNSLRFFMPSNPWGRFLLPVLPLVALPLLLRAADPARTNALRLAIAALSILHVWTAVALLGARYAVGL